MKRSLVVVASLVALAALPLGNASAADRGGHPHGGLRSGGHGYRSSDHERAPHFAPGFSLLPGGHGNWSDSRYGSRTENRWGGRQIYGYGHGQSYGHSSSSLCSPSYGYGYGSGYSPSYSSTYEAGPSEDEYETATQNDGSYYSRGSYDAEDRGFDDGYDENDVDD